jgi:hypothetical protein
MRKQTLRFNSSGAAVMAVETRQEHVVRTNRQAEAERRPADPRPTKPRNARGLLLVLCTALALAVAALSWMFSNNVKYDGTSPVPINERR